MMLSEMNRNDMEIAMYENDSLYAMFDESRLTGAGKYSDDEFRAIIQKWIEDGDECR